jgi:ABC-type branched-subunit amino acid transport system permease subunit
LDPSAIFLYLITLIVYFFIYNILTWGLNIQFGYAGIPNFTYITFFAAGAYFTGVTTLPQSQSQYVQYILGLAWPFPLTLFAGALVAAALGLAVGLITFVRLRSDHLAMVTFSLGFVAYDLVTSSPRIFNGSQGLAGVESPFQSTLGLDFNSYTVFFVGFSGVVMLCCWFVAHRVYNSALGRALRAMRDDIDVAEALGKNTFRLRMIAFVLGVSFAGIAGGLTIEFVTAFNPSGWQTPATFTIWAALLLGGRANNWGSILGSLLVPILLFEGSRFIPPIPGLPYFGFGGRFIVVGALIILVLWFRPQGILPEPKRRFYELPASIDLRMGVARESS